LDIQFFDFKNAEIDNQQPFFSGSVYFDASVEKLITCFSVPLFAV
jgi:hypothetical protein